jgi:hypothetical protein
LHAESDLGQAPGYLWPPFPFAALALPPALCGVGIRTAACGFSTIVWQYQDELQTNATVTKQGDVMAQQEVPIPWVLMGSLVFWGAAGGGEGSEQAACAHEHASQGLVGACGPQQSLGTFRPRHVSSQSSTEFKVLCENRINHTGPGSARDGWVSCLIWGQQKAL